MSPRAMRPPTTVTICVRCTRPEQSRSLTGDLTAHGLRRNERFWYVAAVVEGAALQTALRRRRINVNTHTKTGALQVIAGDHAYAVRGEFSPEQTVAVFSDAIEQATKDGFSRSPAAADMSRALDLK